MPQKKSYKTPVPVKDKKVSVDIDQKWNDVRSTPQLEGYLMTLQRELSSLKKILFSWSIVSQQFMGIKERGILADYIRCYHQYTEFDQFDFDFQVMKDFHSNLERIKNVELIYKSFNLFRHSKWEVRFDSKFVSRLCEYSINQMKYILSMVMFLADGRFLTKETLRGNYGYARPIVTNRAFPYNRFFTVKAFREKNLLVHVGVEKVPILSKNNTVIKRYEFKSYIQFLDVLGDPIVQNPKKLDERLLHFVDRIMQDVAKKDHSEQIQIDQTKLSRYSTYFFQCQVNPYNNMQQAFQRQFGNEQYPFSPLPFKVLYVSSAETSTLVFDKQMKRWISADYLNKIERKKLNEYQRKVNEEMVKRFVDFQSAKTLVELLTKIPNFKVKLTEQEKDVIGQNGNVMVIGRSGTGKTTCAVLRLFSIEMLFKIRLSLYKKKFSSEISNTRCSSDDIDEACGLHCIFLTASPVLTNEIQRYYKKLTDNIKEELQKKKKRAEEERKRKELQQKTIKEEENEEDNSRVQQPSDVSDARQQSHCEEMVEKQQEFQRIDNQEEASQIPSTLERAKSKQIIEQESQMNNQLKDIQLKQDLQNQEFNEDEEDFDRAKQEFEQKLKRYNSLDDLMEKDYPGFFTVKSYIMMIDGTLQKPFFIRNKGSNEILEQNSSKAAWHNEQKGVMMIENYYKNEQNENEKEAQINEKMINEIQDEINYSDEEQLEHEYMRQIQLRANEDKQQLTKKLAANKKKVLMSFEVDFDFFLTHFWPNVNRKFYSSRNITPQLVWTEIYSSIKGSASAYQFPGQYLPQNVYLNNSANVFLTVNQKRDIYEAFCQYERWKIKAGGYDIIDAVNYILNYIRIRGYKGPEIHYVMIDEVQDLPHAILLLLSKTALYGVFYSGDTAQTIAKGVGFRFCDLKSLFDTALQLKKPVVKHLTVNFRSHNNILQLANSIVSSLEILFPKTIDKLAKERSDLDGPKPMILAQNDEEMLFYVLCGEDKTKQAPENNGIKKSPLQFGCDQVIIVRDQQSKEKVPNMLQHALCLTIYEAKGLEFNDVILFNFFTECKSPQKWNLLKYLKVVDYEISKEEYDRNLTRHKEDDDKPQKVKKQGEQNEPQQQIVDSQCIVEQKDQTIKIKKIVSDIKRIMKDINDYAELCSDLKLLYTAITRPRKTLIIYDEDPACRKAIQNMWQNLGIIQIVTKALIEEESMNTNSNTNIFKRVVQATDSNEWKKQGLKMYARGYFQQAMKCFEKSGSQELYNKARANLLADSGTKLLIEVESERNSVKQGFIGYNNLPATELSKLKKKIKRNELRAYEEFCEAAKIFDQMSMFKQAGQCYFSGRKFQNAYKSFISAKMIKQAAQSCESMKEYAKAAQLYDQQGDYLKVIEDLDMINEWEQILKVIKKYEGQMSEIEKSSLLKKYASLALEELVYEIEFQNDEENNNNTEKKVQSNRIEVIQEKQSDEEEDEDSDSELSEALSEQKDKMEEIDPEKEAEQRYKQKTQPIIQDQTKLDNPSENPMLQTVYEPLVAPQKQSVELSFSDLNQTEEKEKELQQNQKPNQQPVQEPMLQTVHEEQSFSDLNASQEPSETVKIEKKSNSEVQPIKPQQEKHLPFKQQAVESSFSDLNESEDFSDLNAKYQKQLEPDIQSIRSMADPQDPWIKSALSVSQINPKSEYSVIDEEQSYNMNVKIIKTKGNIFIQDQIMEKIIRIVSVINSSSTTFLQQFKGYQSLITINKTENSNQDNEIKNLDIITDFEDIDSETINVILDTLESFKLYKLCLFVCNRYHLPQKAGRYLVSIMMKYSTNCQANTIISSGLLAPSSQRKTELQKGILGSIAVHSILENVNSEFLKIKISSNEDQNRQKNTLGTYFIQGLILEGFYKKTVFITNPEESLHVLDNFCDYDLFRDLCRKKYLKNEGEQNQLFLQNVPKTEVQTKYTLISLRDVIAKYQVVNRLDMISYRYYKEFGVYDKINFFKDLKVPNYLPFTKNIMAHGEDLYTFLDKKLPLTYKILATGGQLETADAVLGLLCIMHNNHLQEELFNKSTLKTFFQFYRCIKHIRNVIQHLDGMNSLNILRPILTFYQCKLIQNYKSMSFLGSGYCFLNRTSNMANELIEQAKTSPELFAYFFEQDFNFIMVKISTVMKIIKKKFNVRLSKFLSARADIRRFNNKMLPDDYMIHNQELVLVDALREAVRIINNASGSSKTSKKQTHKKPKDTKSKVGFDFKTHGKLQHSYILYDQQLSEQDEQVQKVKFTRDKYVLPIFDQEMKCIGDQMLSIFNKKVKQSADVIVGRELYCIGMNSYYREYVEEVGGYNLYDAIEFKKFKRVDLYADNVLSIIDTLPIIDKHVFLTEILILLLIEYKRITSKGKQFTIEMSSSYLKFLEDLKFIQAAGQDSDQLREFEAMGSNDLHESIAVDGKKFNFAYNFAYSGELNEQQLMDVICDYIDVVVGEENSQFTNLKLLCKMYLINIDPTVQNVKLYEKLRKSISILGLVWDSTFYKELSKAKNQQQFLQTRQNVLKSTVKLHQITVTCTGDIDEAIKESERDYEIQTRIINGRKKALKKIVSWWRSVKSPSKQKIEKGIVNYFDFMLKRQNPNISVGNDKYKSLNDFRMFEKIYNCNLTLNVPLILTIEKTRQDLLKFYLKHIVSSSLDFHYILITLRKIETIKEQYTCICKQLQSGIVERNISEEIAKIEEGIEQIQSGISVWKNDEKWLKEKNLSLKRKKVFEVKWMTKSLNQMKILRKRAGLRKQDKLQQKKKYIKG